MKHVTVFGAGTMGAGIAQWMAQQDLQTDLIDQSLESAKKAMTKVHASWDKLEAKGKFSKDQVKRFKDSLNPQEKPNPQSDLVIEAVFEDLKLKQDLFKTWDELFDGHTIFASNTSSFPITSLVQTLSPERQKKTLGLHFFNPAPIMKLVEIIRAQETDEEVVQSLKSWFEEKGKRPALCKDSPGFIVNRVARNFYGEAFRLLENDNYSEVDRVMREVGGFRMGPFELMDLIGIDINYNVTVSVWNAFEENSRFAPHKKQKAMVDQGHLGRKTGKGFYSHD